MVTVKTKHTQKWRIFSRMGLRDCHANDKHDDDDDDDDDDDNDEEE